MELLAAVLGAVLCVLAGFLAALAGLASRRFGERRFLLVGSAFGLVSAMAFLALIAELGLVNILWYDEAFALEPVPVAFLLVALVLIYGAMTAPRRSRENPGHGGA
jgi:drug/metabolite transporter (DMT)-like permease